MGEEESDQTHRAFLLQTLTAADPESMKLGFATLIDGAIENATDVIIDWGTSVIWTNRVLDPSDGQEIIAFNMQVHIIKLGGDDDEGQD